MHRLFVLLCLCTALTAHAAEPSIRDINLRGLQIAGSTTLTIQGDDLGKTPRLLLPFPAKHTLKPGSTDKTATFDVALDDKVMPGYYQLRVATEDGASVPIVVGVDRLLQTEGRIDRAVGKVALPSGLQKFGLMVEEQSLPIALHGDVNGSGTYEVGLQCSAKQKVIIEIEAQRLGSKLRPVVHLYNAKNLQLAWAWGTASLSGDTRLETTIPENGRYLVAIHDAEYAGASPGFFRLKIGQWSCIDRVFPSVVGKDHKGVELIGITQAPTLDLPAVRAQSVLPLSWPADKICSGPRPFVRVSPHAETVEQSMMGKPQDLPKGHIGVSGRLLTPMEEDLYRVPVQPGSKLRFEVFAERLGSPVDVSLILRNEMGGELARNEDSPGTLDPVLEYTVPAKVTSVVAAVVDSQGQGGPQGIYRLVVDPRSAEEKADWQVVTTSQRVTLAAGGKNLIPVLVERKGYQGTITLRAEGLPSSVKLENAIVPAGSDGTLLTLQRSDAALEPTVFSLWGKAEDGREQPVFIKSHPLEKLQPWLASELAIGPTTFKAADFVVDWRNLPADAGIVPPTKLTLPVKLTRPTSASVVRLTLLVAQVTPLNNNQPDVNQTLRPERPVELAATLKEGDLAVLVPVQLAAASYDVAVMAELLTPDKRAALATAVTPVRRMALRLPVVLQLDGPARIAAKADPKTGTTVEIKGKIERREGYAGDVPVTLTGLPPGARADAVTVKAGVNVFALKVVFPPNQTGEFKNLKLSATVAPDAKQPNLRVKSRDVDVTLLVQ